MNDKEDLSLEGKQESESYNSTELDQVNNEEVNSQEEQEDFILDESFEEVAPTKEELEPFSFIDLIDDED